MFIIKGCADILVEPITFLFNLVLEQGKLGYSEIWKQSRIPIPKTGSKTAVENYRRIAKFCSLAKIFEMTLLGY